MYRQRKKNMPYITATDKQKEAALETLGQVNWKFSGFFGTMVASFVLCEKCRSIVRPFMEGYEEDSEFGVRVAFDQRNTQDSSLIVGRWNDGVHDDEDCPEFGACGACKKRVKMMDATAYNLRFYATHTE